MLSNTVQVPSIGHAAAASSYLPRYPLCIVIYLLKVDRCVSSLRKDMFPHFRVYMYLTCNITAVLIKKHDIKQGYHSL